MVGRVFGDGFCGAELSHLLGPRLWFFHVPFFPPLLLFSSVLVMVFLLSWDEKGQKAADCRSFRLGPGLRLRRLKTEVTSGKGWTTTETVFYPSQRACMHSYKRPAVCPFFFGCQHSWFILTSGHGALVAVIEMTVSADELMTAFYQMNVATNITFSGFWYCTYVSFWWRWYLRNTVREIL